MINIAILGYGVVGSGVSEVIKKNKNSIARRVGDEIAVKRILDIRDFPDSPDSELITKDSDSVFNDPDIKVIVETIGGTGIAYEFTIRALNAKKHVVTSNKELVATHGPELIQLAKDMGVNYLYEGSVGGGIPIIRPLYQCLAANEITSITGILNGTTNYILTQMHKFGKSFSQALNEAQTNGYAEANPTADIEGHDSCRKIAILSSIAYGEFVDCKNIYTEGITKVTIDDMKYAQHMDCVIKLVGHSEKVGEKVFARVSPAIVPKEHPLSNVEDVFNAIVVRGDAIGDVMFYGRGAGKLPTASAVVADVIDAVKHSSGNLLMNRSWVRLGYDNSLPVDASVTAFFIRLQAKDKAAAIANIVDRFGNCKIIDLGASAQNVNLDEIAFVTLKGYERELKQKLEKLKISVSIDRVESCIRMLE